MAKRKTEFELEVLSEPGAKAKAMIIGERPDYRPYVKIEYVSTSGKETGICVKDSDLERFALNILKALKSKHLKP